jgi:DNA-binding transcriptional regulator YhcF (GntR family)
MPTYRLIAEGIAARIASGALRPGDRVPSTRDIVAEHGVAMATATKALAWLREQGLVRGVPGVGTVVVPVSAPAPRPRVAGPGTRAVVETAVRLADEEGMAGLSMRRVATAAGLPTMSLYRHVADKEELLLLMMDSVFAANPPPPLTPARDGWRACAEAGARLQWAMYRRHRWLAEAVSFTRPLPAPHAMAHTEYTMRALAGLDPDTRFRAAVMIANHVRGTAVNLDAEATARHATGLTDQQWMLTQRERFAAALAGAALPLMGDYLERPGVEVRAGPPARRDRPALLTPAARRPRGRSVPPTARRPRRRR